MEDRCVCCGEIIPEGRQVCPNCEMGVRKMANESTCHITSKRRLIDANALLEEIQFRRPVVDTETKIVADCVAIARKAIVNAPTVDAVEVVHARWSPIRNFGGGECYGYCTNCKTPVKADNATGLVMSNRFCHWCGAKMDGGNEDGST